MSFRWWGHQWLYDWEELERRLKQAGWKKIYRAKWGKSEHIDLQGLEIRGESRLIAEVEK
jgi:predicted SAM-dependent methyltransferase